MTESVANTASASAPPAATIDVTLPKVDWKMRRIFCWVGGLAVLALWAFAIYARAGNVWPYCAALMGFVFVYVVGATSTEIVQLVQSSGIIRAAQATSTAITTAAEAAGSLAGRVLPAPTTGGRSDLAS